MKILTIYHLKKNTTLVIVLLISLLFSAIPSFACWFDSDCLPWEYCSNFTCKTRSCSSNSSCPPCYKCLNHKCSPISGCQQCSSTNGQCGNNLCPMGPGTVGICGVTGANQCICYSLNDCRLIHPDCYNVADASSCTGNYYNNPIVDPYGNIIYLSCCCPDGSCKKDSDCGVPLQDPSTCTQKKCINLHCQSGISYCTGDKKCCDGGGSCITCGCEQDSDCIDKANCRAGTCVPNGGNKECQYPDKSYCCPTCTSTNCQDCGAEYCCNSDESGTCTRCSSSTSTSTRSPRSGNPRKSNPRNSNQRKRIESATPQDSDSFTPDGFEIEIPVQEDADSFIQGDD